MKKTLLYLFFISLSSYVNAQTWTTEASGFANPARGIHDIQIVDANTVWATAYDGSGGTTPIQEFTLTLDGGTTWNAGTINVGNTALTIGDISAVSATTAWVSAFDTTAGLGGVWKTTDGGTTWTAQNTTGFTTAGSSWCDGVHFFDANNGLAYGDPVGTAFEIYTTSDGGATWTPRTSPASVTNEWGYSGSYAYAGNTFWFTTSKGKIYKTTDMGVTWTKLSSPLSDFGSSVTATNYGTLYFTDNNTGIIVGTKDTGTTYKIYTTTNGGTTWNTGVVYTGFLSMCYVPGTTSLVATSANITTGAGSSYSNDNGVTWTSIDVDVQHGVPAFLNATTGWCGGFNSSASTEGMFKFNGDLLLSNQSFNSNNNFKAYPNPANNVINVTTNNIDSYKLRVTDITGKVVLEKALNGIQNSIDISALSNGAYFFTFNSDNKIETAKIIKN